MEDRPPHKRSKPIETLPSSTFATLARVLSTPGFMAFSRIVGLRIANGQATDAHRMLEALGAKPGIAFQIIDGWPLSEEDRKFAPEGTKGLELPEEAAVRLAHFVDDLDGYDWIKVLVVAATAARKRRDADPERGDGAPMR